MANKTKVIRSVDSTPQNYTPLSNKLLQNNKLSLDTRGLLCFLISLPSDWVVYKENIQKQLGFGRKKMDRMWSEAKKGGYLQTEKYREDNGTWNYTYIISDVPLTNVPSSTAALSNVGSSTAGKGGTIISKQEKSNNKQNNNKVYIPSTNSLEASEFKGDNLKYKPEYKDSLSIQMAQQFDELFKDV